MLHSLEKNKPEQCKQVKDWSWNEGDVGYLYHELTNYWIKVVAQKTFGHDYIIFKDDKGMTYFQKAWECSVLPVVMEVE